MSQDRAEGLDDDKLPDDDYPPERPLGVEEYGTTAAEERWDEPLEERLAREEPDTLAPPDPGEDLQAPDDQVADTEALAVPASDATEFDDSALEHEAPVPAEEAALHETDRP